MPHTYRVLQENASNYRSFYALGYVRFEIRRYVSLCLGMKSKSGYFAIIIFVFCGKKNVFYEKSKSGYFEIIIFVFCGKTKNVFYKKSKTGFFAI